LGNSSTPGRGNAANIGNRTNIGDSNKIGSGNRVGNETKIGDRTGVDNSRNDSSRNINVGDVNIGNSVDYSKNQQAWVDNRHVTGNQVRVNAGNRYSDAYRGGAFRVGTVGGYGYSNAWGLATNPYRAWQAPTFAAIGGFVGASLANATPVYYGYGSGGNVYYENNTVYVNDQPSGTPEQYAQQAFDSVASAPPADTVAEEEWMPLGVFAFTQEDMSDSNTMIELAVSKSGVLAGTYFNDSTKSSRPLKGSVDPKSQRAVVGFADGKNPDVALETGIYNLTKDEAPALLHRGASDSSPALLVRLPAPEDAEPQP
jgi:hypothetical protein